MRLQKPMQLERLVSHQQQHGPTSDPAIGSRIFREREREASGGSKERNADSGMCAEGLRGEMDKYTSIVDIHTLFNASFISRRYGYWGVGDHSISSSSGP